jgi:molybdopterin-guanine dinucleotide biosynthesis protein A
MPDTDIAALVLAGGRSSRMGGGDKPLIDLAGRPILARVLDRLRPHHRRVALSANGDPARFAAFGLPVLPDETPCGPLAGILAGLRWAAGQGASHLLTVPGDSPFLPAGLAAALAPAPAMAASDGRRHPTVGLWPTAAAEALAAHLQSLDPARPGDFSVVAFAATLAMRVVAFDTAAGDPFLNINTPADLASAASRLPC